MNATNLSSRALHAFRPTTRNNRVAAQPTCVGASHGVVSRRSPALSLSTCFNRQSFSSARQHLTVPSWVLRAATSDVQPASSKDLEAVEDEEEEEDFFEEGDVLLEVHENEEAVAARLCELVVEVGEYVQACKGWFTLAIPGGSVARALAGIGAAAEGRLDWSKVHLFFVNERCPEAKNFHLAQDTFAGQVGIPPGQVYSVLESDARTLEQQAERYTDLLKKVPDEVMGRTDTGVPSLDLILLGMGADGHVGSIYPNSKEVFEEDKLVAAVSMPSKQSITFTLPLINAAQHVVIAAAGDSKKDTVYKTIVNLETPTGELPGQLVNPCPEGELTWVLDAAAGALLDGATDDADPTHVSGEFDLEDEA